MTLDSGIRIGFQVWGQNVGWDELMAEGRAIEERGFASLWSNDHLWPAAGAAAGGPAGVRGGFFEGWATLAGFIAATTAIPVGVLVSGAGYRNAGLLVKQATALDHMSGGRVTIGLGAGWHEREHRAFGFAYPSLGERIDRLDEQARAIRGLLDGETVSLAGRWVALDGARNEPRQLGRMPLLIGGSGEKRTLAIVARYADAWNGEGDVATWRRKNEALDGHCARVGREPGTIRRTVGLPPACIRGERDEAVRDLARVLVANGIGEDEAIATAAASPLVGDEAAVRSALDAYGDAGAAEAIVDRPAPYDLETLDRLAAIVA